MLPTTSYQQFNPSENSSEASSAERAVTPKIGQAVQHAALSHDAKLILIVCSGAVYVAGDGCGLTTIFEWVCH